MALDPALHAPTRLAILAALRRAGAPVDFSTLQEDLGVTGGNLLSHLRALQQAGVLVAERTAPLGRARTHFQLTAEGEARVRAYALELRSLADVLVG